MTGRGRPRSPEADRAIVEATLELIAEAGLGELSVESVAGRAGVGKATIYRRWAGKQALVEDAFATLNDELPDVPSGGDVRTRLVEMLEQIRCRAPVTQSGRILPRILGHGHSHPELVRAFHERVVEPRRERFRVVLREGVGCGELRPDLDIETAVTLLAAPMLYLTWLSGGGRPPGPDAAARIVDLVLTGLAAAERAPASGS